MRFKITLLFIAGLVCFTGFFLFKNSYSICLSNQFLCSDFFIAFLYPTMFLLGLSLFLSFSVLIFFKLNFLRFAKKIIYASSAFVIVSFLIPAYCSAPLGFCLERKPFIVFYSFLIFFVVFIFSIIQFFKNRAKTP